MQNIGVIMTCHNRRVQTLVCLESLYNCQLPIGTKLDVFMVDDGSIDGTSEEVKIKFPLVNIIKGTGLLFWNRGMRLAWETAARYFSYDFYLWLNDDTILDNDSLAELLKSYNEIYTEQNQEAIICGACRSSITGDKFAYGGRTISGPVIPNLANQLCTFINGNAVLISKNIFHKVGNLSYEYTHALGDYDYGLRASNENFSCFTTKKYIATCPPNEGIPDWSNPKIQLYKRWEKFHSPKGLNIKEYIIFRKKFWGSKWFYFAIKAYFKLLAPRLYKILTVIYLDFHKLKF